MPRKTKQLNVPITPAELELVQRVSFARDVHMTTLIRAALAHSYPELLPLVLMEIENKDVGSPTT